MARHKKWEKFSEAELKEIILGSSTYREALIKLGYSENGNTTQNKIIKEIAEKYDISLLHFSNGQVIDMIGEKVGRLTVIARVPNINGKTARWLCQCECGNQTEVDGTKLRRKETLSCGCLVKEKVKQFNQETRLNDLTRQRFGRLTVLSRAENIGLQPAWICKCDCGTITHPIMGTNLKRGITQSCGCLVSKGEEKIRIILNEYHIKFGTQCQFSDCLSLDGVPLRFDFSVYNGDKLSHLIEYNGRQHYEEIDYFNETLEKRQERDKIKIQYCKENDIPLIIIPYTHYEGISIEDLLLTSKFLYKEDI